MRVFKNKFSKKCAVCKTPVAEGQGFTYQPTNGGYTTICNSSVCLDASPTQVKALLSAPSVREINAKGEIKMPYEADALPILRGMPGARWNGDLKCWTVSLAPKDRERVMEGVRRLNLSFPVGFDGVQQDSSVMDAISRAKDGGAYTYQLDGVKFLSSHDNCLLADDMGLGKTLQALMAIEDGGRAIVLCPATLKLNWANEVRKWRSDLSPVVCKGRKGFKLPAKNEVVIINYEILPTEMTPTSQWGDDSENVPQAWRDVLAQTTLIADEAHLCKSHKAIRSKRTKVLSNLCKKSWAMTGTPLLSKGFDLWGVVSTFGMGRTIFGGFKGFIRDMNAYQNGWGGWEFGTPNPCVPEKLRRVMLRRTKTEVLTNLPPKTYQDVLVEVGSKRLLKMSEKMLEAMKENGSNAIPDFSEFSRIRAELAESRISALEEMVESFEEANEPVVVFSAHRAPIEAMAKRDGWAVIMGDTHQSDREDAVQAFQAGMLKGIACTIKAGGVGITLTKASKMIFCDQEWNPALNLQAEDRICRIGQTASNLQYIRLVSDCAMDLHVLKLIDKKKALIEASIENECGALTSTATTKGGVAIKQETREERDARVAQAIANQARNEVLSQLPMWTRAIPSTLRNQSVDANLQAQIITASEALDNACDGATIMDGRGFNKPDSYVMKNINTSGLLHDLNQQDLLKFAWTKLLKYSGQVGSVAPSLYL
jgi:SWI/SNF-related matrix-associated actin-dependent regulator 1 of chromatin subfamily A